jgi:hypothetical protein
MANVISDIAMSISMAAAAVNERRLLDAAAVKARASLILPQRDDERRGATTQAGD